MAGRSTGHDTRSSRNDGHRSRGNDPSGPGDPAAGADPPGHRRRRRRPGAEHPRGLRQRQLRREQLGHDRIGRRGHDRRLGWRGHHGGVRRRRHHRVGRRAPAPSPPSTSSAPSSASTRRAPARARRSRRRRAGAHGHRIVLRQDDDPWPRPRRQAHRGAGGPTFNYTYLDHKSGDAAAGVQAMAELVAKNIPVKFASYGDDIGVDARRHRRENKMFTLDGGGGTSAVRPGQAVLLGHPGDHAQRSAARPVQVAQGDLPGRQDRRGRHLGPRRRPTTRSPPRTSSPRSPPPATSSTGCTSSCRSAARTSRR